MFAFCSFFFQGQTILFSNGDGFQSLQSSEANRGSASKWKKNYSSVAMNWIGNIEWLWILTERSNKENTYIRGYVVYLAILSWWNNLSYQILKVACVLGINKYFNTVLLWTSMTILKPVYYRRVSSGSFINIDETLVFTYVHEISFEVCVYPTPSSQLTFTPYMRLLLK